MSDIRYAEYQSNDIISRAAILLLRAFLYFFFSLMIHISVSPDRATL